MSICFKVVYAVGLLVAAGADSCLELLDASIRISLVTEGPNAGDDSLSLSIFVSLDG